MTTVATLEAMFTADLTGLQSGLQQADTMLSGAKRTVANKVGQIGATITKVGTTMAPLTLALGAIGAQSISVASSFDSSMAEISARTGIVGEDLETVKDMAIQLGADTAFSANEAADAFLQLLSSGQSVTEAMATLPTVLDLAAASGEDLGMTADSLTDILASFNMGVEDSVKVADALAGAAGASSADIASLVQGFGNVGPVARQFGLDVFDTAAALAVLSENGIKGAEAGTALKSMLLNMTRDTNEVQGAWEELGTSFYDASGNARPLNDVLADIKLGLEGMPVEEQNRLLQDLAGSYGIVALQALLGDLSIEDMKDSMDEQASAADVAKARMDTFAGAVDSLGGSVETLQINAFTPFMNNTLRPFLEGVTEAINAVGEWAGKNPELTNTVLTLAAGVFALGTASLALGPLLSAVGAVIGAVSLPMLLGVGVVYAYTQNFGGLKDAVGDTVDAIKNKDIVGVIEGISSALLAIPKGIAEWVAGDVFGIDVDASWEAWDNTLTNIQTIIDALPGLIQGWIDKAAEIILPEPVSEIWTALGGIEGILDNLPELATGMIDALAKIILPDPLAEVWDAFGGIKGALDVMGGLVDGFISALGKITIPDALTAIKNTVDSIVSGLEAIAGAILPGGGDEGDGHHISTAVDTSVDPGAGMPAAPEGMHYAWGGKGGQQPTLVPDGTNDSGGHGMADRVSVIGTGAQPEVFVPDTAGTFYPRGEGLLGGPTINLQGATLILQGVQDPASLLAQIEDEAGRQNKRITW